MRNPVPPADTFLAPAVLAHIIHADLAKPELPPPPGPRHDRDIPLLPRLPRRLPRIFLLLLDPAPLPLPFDALIPPHAFDPLALQLDQLRMRDPVVGGQERVIEDFGGVAAGEDAGLRGRVEDLLQRGLVDGEVVDGFVWTRHEAGMIGGGGQHGEDGAGVGASERFVLGVWTSKVSVPSRCV